MLHSTHPETSSSWAFTWHRAVTNNAQLLQQSTGLALSMCLHHRLATAQSIKWILKIYGCLHSTDRNIHQRLISYYILLTTVYILIHLGEQNEIIWYKYIDGFYYRAFSIL